MKIKITIFLFLFSFLVHNNNIAQEQPIIYIHKYLGLLGNQIYEIILLAHDNAKKMLKLTK